MKQSLLFSCLLLFLLSSCTNDENSSCTSCRNAIVALANNIANVSCDPDMLASDKQRVKDDCPNLDIADVYIGYVAEFCNANSFVEVFVPPCVSNLPSPATNDLAIVPQIEVETTNLPDTIIVDLIPLLTGDTLSDILYPDDMSIITGGPSIIEGIIYSVEVFDLSLQQVAQANKEFTFAREGVWLQNRKIKITYNQPTQSYEISFVDWN